MVEMMKKIVAFIFSFMLVHVAMASPVLDVLSDADESLYSQIFMMQDSEKFTVAEKLQRQLSDPILINEIYINDIFPKIIIPRGPRLRHGWINILICLGRRVWKNCQN